MIKSGSGKKVMNSFLDKAVELFSVAETNKTKITKVYLRIPQEMGVFDRGTHMCRELAKKIIKAAIHSGLLGNWKTMQETIATPGSGV